MLGAGLLGAAAAFVGTFAVLRRRALVGDMLSHAALPGIAGAFMVWHSRNLLTLSFGALLTGLLGVLCVAAIAKWTRTHEDAALGIVLSTFFGAGVVMLTLLQSDPRGNQAGLNSYLFGEIASLRSRDLVVIAATALGVLLLVMFFYKELKVLSFDIGFAAAQGWPTFWLDLGIMSAVAVVTIIGLPICGVVLMAAMLITPAAAARFWTNRLGRLLATSALLGAAAGVGGCVLAAPKLLSTMGLGWVTLGVSQALPPGPLIVLTGAVLLVLSMLFAPQRGVVARMWSEYQLRARVQRDHLLRALYELCPKPESDRPWISADRLIRYGQWTKSNSGAAFRRARRERYIECDDQRVRFTPAGFEVASQLVRAHRLWELYMLEDWNSSPERVHRDADALEHLLPPEVVEHLESLLLARGQLATASSGEVPASPHELQVKPKE